MRTSLRSVDGLCYGLLPVCPAQKFIIYVFSLRGENINFPFSQGDRPN
ncbi:hypothetical protein MCEMSE15_02197 [Fimbriimonadaceae bacterium]